MHHRSLPAVVCVLVSVTAGGSAAAQEVRSVVGIDSFVSSTQGLNSAAVADVAVSGVIDATSEDERQSLQLDFVNRESVIGRPARRELHTLAYTWNIGGPAGRETAEHSASAAVAVTLGRFRVPGGFWLIADGAMIEIGNRNRQSFAVVAGSRAFANARSELHLRGNPVMLPLFAASAQTRRDRITATASYTYTRDQVVLPLTGGDVLVRTPDQYVDAAVAANALNKRVFVDGGLSLGTRYIIDPQAADAIASSITLGSQTGYGAATLKLPAWRFSLALTASRSKIDRSSAASSSVSAPTLAALGGTFVDQSARAGWHGTALTLTARYRTRWRPTLRLGHRATFDLRWKIRPLEMNAGVGYAQQPARNDVELPGSKTVLARVSAGLRTSSVQTTIGAVAQSDVSDRTVISTTDAADQIDSSTNLFTLQNRNYLFGRLNWQHDQWLIGADVEVTPTFDQVRALVQVMWGFGWKK